MSRIAKIPIIIPNNVSVNFNKKNIIIKGKMAELICIVHKFVNIELNNNKLTFSPYKNYINGWMFAGTMRSLINNMIIGVTTGFSKKLQLIGIGYKAIITKNVISLFLGLSHSIDYTLPTGIIAECNQNEILIKGSNKQLVGQVAANLRAYRVPEPYKGKGIRYINEIVLIKSTKKK